MLESTDNLSDHEPLFCHLDCCIDDLPPNIDDSCTLNKKPLCHLAKNSDIEVYKCILDNCFLLYSLNACIILYTIARCLVVALCLILML